MRKDHQSLQEASESRLECDPAKFVPWMSRQMTKNQEQFVIAESRKARHFGDEAGELEDGKRADIATKYSKSSFMHVGAQTPTRLLFSAPR